MICPWLPKTKYLPLTQKYIPNSIRARAPISIFTKTTTNDNKNKIYTHSVCIQPLNLTQILTPGVRFAPALLVGRGRGSGAIGAAAAQHGTGLDQKESQHRHGTLRRDGEVVVRGIGVRIRDKSRSCQGDSGKDQG